MTYRDQYGRESLDNYKLESQTQDSILSIYNALKMLCIYKQISLTTESEYYMAMRVVLNSHCLAAEGMYTTQLLLEVGQDFVQLITLHICNCECMFLSLSNLDSAYSN